ncbi:uncharacterized protein LOC128991170 [Macrosteles quadrilineatus]|uniref:uncharacterized protein LOC128991170 n=1 Tax=Macrosteles quadrilineatus TaxID=74068 RepID=UPI0023E343A9|nr:uncharacterized protein LOC128991170 [Macrosteles quadrilineatus]
MVSLIGIIIIILGVFILVSGSPTSHHSGYVLMPIQVADKILDKDIEKVEKVSKLSYALLKDLQENQDKYPTSVVSRTFARVAEEAAEVLGSSLRDIKTLIYPNGL